MARSLRLWGLPFHPPPTGLAAPDVLGGCTATPGLYVHIPFCSRICPFCPYNKVRYAPREAGDYLALLQRELAGYLTAAREPFTSLYVGGGTPTLCLPRLDFLADVPVSAERAMEILPSHMTARTARRLTGLGFDSVSIGAQSFHDRVLRHLQRPSDAATNRRAVACAREHFPCVDVDLIFDVAYDGPDTLLADLAEAFRFEVDQVSAYPLMRFGYTPFGKAEHARRAEHAVLRQASELARRHGYRRDSVWTFAREGGRRYTSITRPYYVGVGAGAASFTGRSFAVNHFGLDAYAGAVHAGQLPVALMTELPGPARTAFRAFWQSYTGAIDAAGDPLLHRRWVEGALRGAAAAGLLCHRSAGGYALTDRGYEAYHDLERFVTYRLIEPLWEQMMREHAAA